jgi:hypothetical protein
MSENSRGVGKQMKPLFVMVAILFFILSGPLCAGKPTPIPAIKGMLYVKARPLLLSRGWRPRLVCSPWSDGCARERGMGGVFLKDGLTEVEVCAVDRPLCIMNFVDTRKRCLRLVVEGDTYPNGEEPLKVVWVGRECPGS